MQTSRDRLRKSSRERREERRGFPSLHKRRLLSSTPPPNAPGSRWPLQRPSLPLLSPPVPVALQIPSPVPSSLPASGTPPLCASARGTHTLCSLPPPPADLPLPGPATPAPTHPHPPAGGTFSRGSRASRVPAGLQARRQPRPERGQAQPAAASHLSEGVAAGRGLTAPLTPEGRREEGERISSSAAAAAATYKTSGRAPSHSVFALRASSGHQRRARHPLAARPGPGAPAPLARPLIPGPALPPPWGSCLSPAHARAAAPLRAEPAAVPALSSATLR